jgi:hypothetical protein
MAMEDALAMLPAIHMNMRRHTFERDRDRNPVIDGDSSVNMVAEWDGAQNLGRDDRSIQDRVTWYR